MQLALSSKKYPVGITQLALNSRKYVVGIKQ